MASGQILFPKTINYLLLFKTKPSCSVLLHPFEMTGILYREWKGQNKIQNISVFPTYTIDTLVWLHSKDRSHERLTDVAFTSM